MSLSIVKVSLREVNPHLVCVLCGGYLIEPTTIQECLHSFCRSCLLRYLESSEVCPICDVQVSKDGPHTNIREDRTLQDLVYKMVPGLFQSEMERRRDFYAATHSDSEDSLDSCSSDDLVLLQEERGQVTGHKYPDVLRHDDDVSVCLILSDRPPPYRNGLKKTSKQETVLDRRYLLCPAQFPIHALKKFIKGKFELSDSHEVCVYHKEEVLADGCTLLDVCYIYNWNQAEPLRLYYTVTEQLPSYPHRRQHKSNQSTSRVGATDVDKDHTSHQGKNKRGRKRKSTTELEISHRYMKSSSDSESQLKLCNQDVKHTTAKRNRESFPQELKIKRPKVKLPQSTKSFFTRNSEKLMRNKPSKHREHTSQCGSVEYTSKSSQLNHQRHSLKHLKESKAHKSRDIVKVYPGRSSAKRKTVHESVLEVRQTKVKSAFLSASKVSLLERSEKLSQQGKRKLDITKPKSEVSKANDNKEESDIISTEDVKCSETISCPISVDEPHQSEDNDKSVNVSSCKDISSLTTSCEISSVLNANVNEKQKQIDNAQPAMPMKECDNEITVVDSAIPCSVGNYSDCVTSLPASPSNTPLTFVNTSPSNYQSGSVDVTKQADVTQICLKSRESNLSSSSTVDSPCIVVTSPASKDKHNITITDQQLLTEKSGPDSTVRFILPVFQTTSVTSTKSLHPIQITTKLSTVSELTTSSDNKCNITTTGIPISSHIVQMNPVSIYKPANNTSVTACTAGKLSESLLSAASARYSKEFKTSDTSFNNTDISSSNLISSINNAPNSTTVASSRTAIGTSAFSGVSTLQRGLTIASNRVAYGPKVLATTSVKMGQVLSSISTSNQSSNVSATSSMSVTCLPTVLTSSNTTNVQSNDLIKISNAGRQQGIKTVTSNIRQQTTMCSSSSTTSSSGQLDVSSGHTETGIALQTSSQASSSQRSAERYSSPVTSLVSGVELTSSLVSTKSGSTEKCRIVSHATPSRDVTKLTSSPTLSTHSQAEVSSSPTVFNRGSAEVSSSHPASTSSDDVFGDDSDHPMEICTDTEEDNMTDSEAENSNNSNTCAKQLSSDKSKKSPSSDPNECKVQEINTTNSDQKADQTTGNSQRNDDIYTIVSSDATSESKNCDSKKFTSDNDKQNDNVTSLNNYPNQSQTLNNYSNESLTPQSGKYDKLNENVEQHKDKHSSSADNSYSKENVHDKTLKSVEVQTDVATLHSSPDSSITQLEINSKNNNSENNKSPSDSNGSTSIDQQSFQGDDTDSPKSPSDLKRLSAAQSFAKKYRCPTKLGKQNDNKYLNKGDRSKWSRKSSQDNSDPYMFTADDNHNYMNGKVTEYDENDSGPGSRNALALLDYYVNYVHKPHIGQDNNLQNKLIATSHGLVGGPTVIGSPYVISNEGVTTVKSSPLMLGTFNKNYIPLKDIASAAALQRKRVKSDDCVIKGNKNVTYGKISVNKNTQNGKILAKGEHKMEIRTNMVNGKGSKKLGLTRLNAYTKCLTMDDEKATINNGLQMEKTNALLDKNISKRNHCFQAIDGSVKDSEKKNTEKCDKKIPPLKLKLPKSCMQPITDTCIRTGPEHKLCKSISLGNSEETTKSCSPEEGQPRIFLRISKSNIPSLRSTSLSSAAIMPDACTEKVVENVEMKIQNPTIIHDNLEIDEDKDIRASIKNGNSVNNNERNLIQHKICINDIPKETYFKQSCLQPAKIRTKLQRSISLPDIYSAVSSSTSFELSSRREPLQIAKSDINNRAFESHMDTKCYGISHITKSENETMRTNEVSSDVTTETATGISAIVKGTQDIAAAPIVVHDKPANLLTNGKEGRGTIKSSQLPTRLSQVSLISNKTTNVTMTQISPSQQCVLPDPVKAKPNIPCTNPCTPNVATHAERATVKTLNNLPVTMVCNGHDVGEDIRLRQECTAHSSGQSRPLVRKSKTDKTVRNRVITPDKVSIQYVLPSSQANHPGTMKVTENANVDLVSISEPSIVSVIPINTTSLATTLPNTQSVLDRSGTNELASTSQIVQMVMSATPMATSNKQQNHQQVLASPAQIVASSSKSNVQSVRPASFGLHQFVGPITGVQPFNFSTGGVNVQPFTIRAPLTTNGIKASENKLQPLFINQSGNQCTGTNSTNNPSMSVFTRTPVSSLIPIVAGVPVNNNFVIGNQMGQHAQSSMPVTALRLPQQNKISTLGPTKIIRLPVNAQFSNVPHAEVQGLVNMSGSNLETIIQPKTGINGVTDKQLKGINKVREPISNTAVVVNDRRPSVKRNEKLILNQNKQANLILPRDGKRTLPSMKSTQNNGIKKESTQETSYNYNLSLVTNPQISYVLSSQFSSSPISACHASSSPNLSVPLNTARLPLQTQSAAGISQTPLQRKQEVPLYNTQNTSSAVSNRKPALGFQGNQSSISTMSQCVATTLSPSIVSPCNPTCVTHPPAPSPTDVSSPTPPVSAMTSLSSAVTYPVTNVSAPVSTVPCSITSMSFPQSQMACPPITLARLQPKVTHSLSSVPRPQTNMTRAPHPQPTLNCPLPTVTAPLTSIPIASPLFPITGVYVGARHILPPHISYHGIIYPTNGVIMVNGQPQMELHQPPVAMNTKPANKLPVSNTITQGVNNVTTKYENARNNHAVFSHLTTVNSHMTSNQRSADGSTVSPPLKANGYDAPLELTTKRTPVTEQNL